MRGGAFCCFRVKKVQLSDAAQGTRSPIRHLKRSNNQNVRLFAWFSGLSSLAVGVGCLIFELDCSYRTEVRNMRLIIPVIARALQRLKLTAALQQVLRIGWCCQSPGTSLLLVSM